MKYFAPGDGEQLLELEDDWHHLVRMPKGHADRRAPERAPVIPDIQDLQLEDPDDFVIDEDIELQIIVEPETVPVAVSELARFRALEAAVRAFLAAEVDRELVLMAARRRALTAEEAERYNAATLRRLAALQALIAARA